MPNIIPIRDLRDTGAISQMCHETPDPIFITKNGYGDMVIMSIETYEEKLYMLDIRTKLAEAESQIVSGNTVDAENSLKNLRKKYNV